MFDCGQIVKNNPISVRLTNGKTMENVPNHKLISITTNDIGSICQYNKKLIENTKIIIESINKEQNKFVYVSDFDSLFVCVHRFCALLYMRPG